MINLAEIKKQYPGINGFEKSLLREFLQYKILNIIFSGNYSRKISFLGGTAIKICYNSQRFSEDLDFDNFGLSQNEFSNLVNDVKAGLEKEGYPVESRLVFKGAYRAYIKIPQLLKDNNLSNMMDEKILIQIDSAPHGFKYEPNNFLLQKFDVFKSIKVTPIDIILSQKATAVFNRKRAKGRDYYDVVYLMGQTGFNYEYLNFKLGIKNQQELKDRFLKQSAQLNFRDLARDVKPFLINPQDQERILSFRQYIEQEL